MHRLAWFLALPCLLPVQTRAASLQVTPVMLEVVAPGAASLLTVQNTGPRPIVIQTRIFRWLQDAGQERLEPTTDVVASPPAIELRPSQDYVVRVVRIRKSPIEGEEAYRLLIDELPEPQMHARTITFTVRHSIPLFFELPNSSPAQTAWRITRSAVGLSTIASNTGDARLRLANVRLSDDSGWSLSLGSGLVGYVLGRSTMSWSLAAGKTAPAGTRLTITGQTQEGPIRAQAIVEPAR